MRNECIATFMFEAAASCEQLKQQMLGLSRDPMLSSRLAGADRGC